MEKTTYLYDTNGESLGDVTGLLPITLFKGMAFTIHGYDCQYKVVDWNYHHGPPDEGAGLRIILERQ